MHACTNLFDAFVGRNTYRRCDRVTIHFLYVDSTKKTYYVMHDFRKRFEEVGMFTFVVLKTKKYR